MPRPTRWRDKRDNASRFTLTRSQVVQLGDSRRDQVGDVKRGHDSDRLRCNPVLVVRGQLELYEMGGPPCKGHLNGATQSQKDGIAKRTSARGGSELDTRP